MKYHEDKYGNKISLLGLGCMRFPRDKKETESMILRAIEGGVNIFDTAYIYPNSEATLGEILAKNDKRKDVYISTKLPLGRCKNYEDFDKILFEQFKRLQTDYIDYYFLHAMSGWEQWQAMREMGVLQWIDEKKAAGQIKQLGFSYHGTCDDFLKIIKDYDWDFCMIQYNYSDEDYQAGKTGLKAAAARGIPVWVMEPLLGGKLAMGLPDAAVKAFAKVDAAKTPAQWAFAWIWSQPEVTLTLSGMGSTQQMEQNLQTVADFAPLTDAQLAVYDDVITIFKKTNKINCQSCNYCIPCPQGINIPSCFSAYNASFSHGLTTGFMQYATSTAVMSKKPSSVRDCNGCGLCEKACPQNIPIRAALKRVGRRFENPPLRVVWRVVRSFINK